MLLLPRIPHTRSWNSCPPDENPTTRKRKALWLFAAAIPLSLIGLLTALVRDHPYSGHDQAVLAWIQTWHLPGLAGFFTGISFLSDNWPSDVAGGYLLGSAVLLGLAAIYQRVIKSTRGWLDIIPGSGGRLRARAERVKGPGFPVAERPAAQD